jgi:phosphodiesterase/alkaline phosphatase D-like protein
VGRFRTLRPSDSREPVRIAFFSCQDYQAGFYGAQSAIANEDVDLAVCLGDYIYERTFYEGPRRASPRARRPSPSRGGFSAAASWTGSSAGCASRARRGS